MSIRIFHQDHYEVRTGWDQPLQYFFLTIEDMRDPDSEDSLLYSNLCRRDPSMSLVDIVDVLNWFSIYPPSDLMNDLRRDQISNVGNLEVTYQHNGIKAASFPIKG